ncbi:MAG: 2-succinyl-5-enolpyruvyl-6-hydroxy-3-cyclohexene-1-carboxylic-acid synthase, partial [Crocinitomicaceae bacterium]|nr:2-succinyl-5-enolpyruvyl-6-hydroxy-3-cyclohexene-1-carboxylic-acid synthase [Crocinitomicaceae bacterium]
MNYSDHGHVNILLGILLENGIDKAVFSPGSRNAPLVVSFSGDEKMETVVIPDERSAGFFALGMAQQLKRPVCLVCTSGSAALNYAPAISEAYYQNIPLIVVTADRPEYLIGQGDGQTINQKNIFGNYVQSSYSLPLDPKDELNIHWCSRIVSEAISEAVNGERGPVHINIPLEEPLYGKTEQPTSYRSFKTMKNDQEVALEDEKELLDLWNASGKKMIICGLMHKDEYLNHLLDELASRPDVAVLVENTSNLYSDRFNHCIDRSLNSINMDQVEEFVPDLLIRIGGPIVSKKIKKLFRDHKPKFQWNLGRENIYMDSFMSLTHVINTEPSKFLSVVHQKTEPGDVSFGPLWKQIDYLVKDHQVEVLKSMPYCDLTAFYTILDFIPEDSILQMGNSSVVRYCQLFDPVKTVQYFANRGTSGIDGSTSTAVGCAYVHKKKWINFITGDISFFYDSNAFWNDYLQPNLVVFLINNSGGSIFKIIDGPVTTGALEKHFVASPAHASAEYIAKA